MTTWSNADLLVELLERHQAMVLEQADERRLLFLRRWLAFVDREPQLSGLVQELVEQVNTARAELSKIALEIQSQLVQLWQDYGDDIQKHETLVPEDNGRPYSVHFEEVLPRLRRTATVGLRDGELDLTPLMPALIVGNALEHWLASICTRCERDGKDHTQRIQEARERCVAAQRQKRYLERNAQLLNETMPGVALLRIRRLAAKVNPRPPHLRGAAIGTNSGRRESSYLYDDAFAGRLYNIESARLRELEEDDVNRTAGELEVDLRVVTHELQIRVIIGRSRLALMRRYAARCQAFNAAALRELARNSKGKVEDRLALDFAMYLFDQGLSPILNPTIGGLRPDLVQIDGQNLMYVEAKQYGGTNAKRTVVNAYKQVWSTWERLDTAHRVNEAFLVVFRVSGPLGVLPQRVRYRDRTLHSLLVDISEEGGSKERRRPFTILEADVVPEQGLAE